MGWEVLEDILWDSCLSPGCSQAPGRSRLVHRGAFPRVGFGVWIRGEHTGVRLGGCLCQDARATRGQKAPGQHRLGRSPQSRGSATAGLLQDASLGGELLLNPQQAECVSKLKTGACTGKSLPDVFVPIKAEEEGEKRQLISWEQRRCSSEGALPHPRVRGLQPPPPPIALPVPRALRPPSRGRDLSQQMETEPPCLSFPSCKLQAITDRHLDDAVSRVNIWQRARCLKEECFLGIS